LVFLLEDAETPLRPVFFPVVAADRDDEPGVLGNLPRSRPGRRSDKRGGTSASTRAKKPPAKKPAAARAKPATHATPRPRPQAQPRSRPAPAARKTSPDPVGQAIELAGKAAALGVRTAAGIVKRLPRP
jgi:hypothetical protein